MPREIGRAEQSHCDDTEGAAHAAELGPAGH